MQDLKLDETRRTGTGQRERQTICTHTHKVMGNRWKQSGQGRQSDRWEHTRGRGKLPETRGKLDVKIKQEATRQHRHKTKLNITNLTF